MYVEKLKDIGLDDILSMYPDFQKYKNVLFNSKEPNTEINTIFHTIGRDYTAYFDIILEHKFMDFPIKIGSYKENSYRYNECLYILDCSQWNIQQLREFLLEYCCLTNVMMRTNLFVIYNFNIVDKNTQETLGTLIEKNIHRARFWIITSSISKIVYKITSRVLIANIRRPSRQQLKDYLIKISHKPVFEILIDKILEKADDYSTALLYLDMLSVDATVLNRHPFQEDIETILRFIDDKSYRETNYPQLRETCYNLLEKLNFIDILKLFIRQFCHMYNSTQIALIVQRASQLENQNIIPNKQIWLLENWFLYIILVINDLPTILDGESYQCKNIKNTIGVPLII